MKPDPCKNHSACSGDFQALTNELVSRCSDNPCAITVTATCRTETRQRACVDECGAVRSRVQQANCRGLIVPVRLLHAAETESGINIIK